MLYVPSVTLDYGGSDFKEKWKNNRTDRSKKEPEDLIGKPEECGKIGQMCFQPFSY